MIEMVGFLAPPPVVCDQPLIIQPSPIILDPGEPPVSVDFGWPSEPCHVVYALPTVDAPDLAFSCLPIPGLPSSNPGAAAVMVTGQGVADVAEIPGYSAAKYPSGPGAADVTVKADEG
jgi:hypothetical protein